MALEIRHNKAENSHENVQFGRIANYWQQYFEYKEWDGLLIGNPEHVEEEFSQFRADAILLYEGGLLILDLKDYSGELILPEPPKDFAKDKWFCKVDEGENVITVDGGSFANPFMQLGAYRYVMKNIIRANDILKSNLKGNRVGSVNLFSGPITQNSGIPGKFNRAYFIFDEDHLKDLVRIYNSDNTYSAEVAQAFKKIFPAPEWEDDFETTVQEKEPERVYEIGEDLDSHLKTFLEKEGPGILVLESMDTAKRDEWVEYLFSLAGNGDIPQRDIWTHSSRIRRKIAKRSRINPDSLYTTIYGGNRKIEEKEDIEENENENVEGREIVPLRSDDFLDEKGLVILHEAHLVTRSLNQSDLLRFGSGRLLEDLIGFLRLEDTSRKLICVGDPFSLSYGKEEESALALENLAELFEGHIAHYRAPFQTINDSVKEVRTQLAKAIDVDLFNSLKINFDTDHLIKNDKAGTLELLKDWFGETLSAEPENAMLVFSNKDAHKINLWVKDKFLKNTKDLAQGDLLLMNNNVFIPDETGLGVPRNLSNGMYLLVREVLERKTIPISSNNLPQQVNLEYIKIQVQCLSLEGEPLVEIWLLNNYFSGDDKLSREEEIALRILLGIKMKEYKHQYPFDTSEEKKLLLQDTSYGELLAEINDFRSRLSKGEKVKTKLDETERKLRKLERKYVRQYNQGLTFKVSKEDPILNAVQVKYGWCITVHKAVGTQFSNICINASQGKENGYTNAAYYRWLYTGISTALSKVFVLNPVEIDPLKDCQFFDVDEISTTGYGSSKKSKITYNFIEAELSSWLKDLIIPNLSPNVKAAIFHFSEKLNQVGIVLEETIPAGEYLTKARFSLPELNAPDLIMLFDNNGKGELSSIRVERNGEQYLSAIEEGIEYVKAQAVLQDDPGEKIPEDFISSFYNQWMEKSASTGGNLQLISTHNYDDIFVFSQGDDRVKFKVTFGKSGFFSSFRVLKKSNPLLSKEVFNLLFND